MGPCLPKFLEDMVILCFDRRFSKQNRVISLKSNILAPLKFLGYATVMVSVDLQRIECGCKYLCCSFSRKIIKMREA